MMKSGSLSMAKTVQSKDGDSTSSASRSVQPVRMGPETDLNLLRRTVQRAACEGCGPSEEGIAAELARLPPHQRASAVMGMQQTLGNGCVGRLAVQAKLVLGPVGDRYEQEADRVAQRVVETIATSEEGTDQKATQQSEDRSAMKTLERAPKPDDCLTLGSDIRRSPLFSFTPAKCAFPVLQRYVNVGLYEGALGFDHIGIGVNTENMSGFSPVAGSGQDAEAGSWVDGEVKEDRGLIESLVIKTNSEQEAKIQGAINRSTSTPPMFNLYQHNCAHQAAEMLNSGGLNVRSSQIPRTFFAGLKSNSGWKENREEPAQMKYSIGSFVEGGIDTDLESAIHRERSGGRPLPEGVRQLMERAFGADFGSVRVHADGEADSLNRSLQARAFTTGQDVFFRSGEYRPTSSEGQRLLAHELTHVIQQSKGHLLRAPQVSHLTKDGVFQVQLAEEHYVGRQSLTNFKIEVTNLIRILFENRSDVKLRARNLNALFIKLQAAVADGRINRTREITWVKQQFIEIQQNAHGTDYDFNEINFSFSNINLRLEKKSGMLFVDGAKGRLILTPERHQLPSPSNANIAEFKKGLTEGRIAELFLTLEGLEGHRIQVQQLIIQLCNHIDAGDITWDIGIETLHEISNALVKAANAAKFNYKKIVFNFRGKISDLGLEKSEGKFFVNGRPFY